MHGSFPLPLSLHLAQKEWESNPAIRCPHPPHFCPGEAILLCTLTVITLQIKKTHKLANLISKLNFYKLIPYPMDNCFTGRRRPARQTTEKVALYECIMPSQAGRSHCALARWRVVLPSCLDSVTS